MKKLSILSVLLIGTLCMFTSCSNDEETTEVAKQETVIKTTLTAETVASTIDEIDKLYEQEIRTRDVGGVPAMTEEKAKELLDPYIEEGKNVREQILADMRANPTDYPIGSGIELSQMSDDQLAELGFIVNDYNTSPKIVAYGLPKWFDCLGSAFGLGRDGFSAYINGTKQLMTARAGLAIAKALDKRTLGMIGVAIAVYEYYDCMR